MAAMQKILKAETMANGLILVIDTPDGKEERYIVADDGSAAFRTIQQAATKASGASGNTYHEPPEPEAEAPRASTIDEDGHEADDDDYSDDDDSIVGDARVLLGGIADFVNSNPAAGQFLGSVISGMNQAEAKRHRVRSGQAKKRK